MNAAFARNSYVIMHKKGFSVTPAIPVFWRVRFDCGKDKMYMEQHFSDNDNRNTVKFDVIDQRQGLWMMSANNAFQTDRFPRVDEILDRVTQKTKSVAKFK